MAKENEAPQNANVLTLGKCAKRLGMDKSNIRKQIKSGKYGNIMLRHVRNDSTGRQKALAISEEDFELIKNMREQEGFGVTSIVANDLRGYFYIIQTNPHHIPNRYKFGFTANLQNRMAAYKSVCPNAKLVSKYACDRFHEQPLLKMMGKYGTRIGVELFEIEDIDVVKGDIETVLSILL